MSLHVILWCLHVYCNQVPHPHMLVLRLDVMAIMCIVTLRALGKHLFISGAVISRLDCM